MNGATAWNPAPARAGSRCSQVQAVSGNPCRHSASGPDPASSSPNSRTLARTVVLRNPTGAVMGDTLPAVLASVSGDRTALTGCGFVAQEKAHLGLDSQTSNQAPRPAERRPSGRRTDPISGSPAL